MPNDQSKQLIGKWLVQTQTCTNQSYAAASNPDVSALKDVVFQANGKFKEKSGLFSTDSDTFEVTEEKSGNGQVNVIKFAKKWRRTFRVSNDSLFITEGSCTLSYTRK